MNYPNKMLIEHHIKVGTPLRVLAGYVRSYEEKYADKGVPWFRRKARQMRSVITAVFIHRYTNGEYNEGDSPTNA